MSHSAHGTSSTILPGWYPAVSDLDAATKTEDGRVLLTMKWRVELGSGKFADTEDMDPITLFYDKTGVFLGSSLSRMSRLFDAAGVAGQPLKSFSDLARLRGLRVEVQIGKDGKVNEVRKTKEKAK